MESERGFARERDWTQGPAKWAAVVVLGAACVLTSAWVMTGRVMVERRAEGSVARTDSPASDGVHGVEAQTSEAAPPLSMAGEVVGPRVETAPAVESELVRTSEPAADTGAGASASITRRINVNTASTAELELLPGVGPKLAERIVEHRRVHGAFKKVEDLDGVSGIGPRILERLRGLVTVE